MDNSEKRSGTKRKDRTSPEVQKGDSTKKVRARTLSLTPSEEESFQEESDRARTPSGTVIPDLSTIRGYFSPSNKIPKSSKEADLKIKASETVQARKCARESLKSEENKAKPPLSAKAVQPEKSVNRTKINNKTSNGKQKEKVITSAATDITSTPVGAETSHTSKELSRSGKGCDIPSPDENTLKCIDALIRTETVTYEDFKKKIEMQKGNEKDKSTSTCETSSASLQTEEMEYQDESNARDEPKTVTLTLIYEMFKDLKQEFTNMKKDSAETETKVTEEVLKKVSEQATDAAAQCANNLFEHDYKDNMDKISSELKHCQLKNDILSNICTSMSTEIADLNSKIENLELSASKKMIIMSGWKTNSTNKEDCIQELENFFDRNLQAAVVVDDYFYLGQSLVIDFQCASDKRIILKNKALLKNYPTKIYINEYAPIATSEKRKRERQIIQNIDEMCKDMDTQVNVEYTRAGLTIQGEPYRKKVSPPTPKEMIELDLKQLNCILNIKMRKGKTVLKDGSRFTAYSADATTHQQVREMYIKLKLIKPEARHIVCAYILPGSHHTDRDFHDDGEPGSGRILLKMMEEKGLSNTAIFVVRRYGGVKLGSTRFGCYRQAVDSMIEHSMDMSTSSVDTNYQQKDTVQEPNRRRTNPRYKNDARLLQQSQQSHRPQMQQNGYHNRTHNPSREYRSRGQHSVRRPYSSTRRGASRGGYNTHSSGPGDNQRNRYEELIQSQQRLQQMIHEFDFANPINRLQPNE